MAPKEDTLPQMERLKLILPADKRYLKLVGAVVQEICAQMPRLPSADAYNVQLAVDEALATTISQAYHDDAAQDVELAFEMHPDRLVIQVRDWGKSFDATAMPEPDLDQIHEQSYGMFLVRLMDSVSYDADPVTGNCVTLVKRIR
jgi:anti-sigma regulatory factor (Ser/Thr protein kinase)